MTPSGWANKFDVADGIRNYDTVLVPRCFMPWASVLLDEVAPTPGDSVLDVACGPGTVTRIAARRVGASGRVTGCDVSPAMLDRAREKAANNGAAPIEYLECSAEALTVPDAAFDVITCQQGLQFFPDRVGALAEMRRAGRPGARVGIACWTTVEESPVFAAMGRAVGAVLGADAAATFQGGPWGLSDANELLGYVDAAGLVNARLVRRKLPVVFEGGVDQLLLLLTFAPVAGQVGALGADGLAALREAMADETASLTVVGEIRSEAASHLAYAEV